MEQQQTEKSNSVGRHEKINHETISSSLKAKFTPEELEAYFRGDTELALFFGAWLDNNRNATRAYLQLHPNVSYASAKTLGSRMLTKVDFLTILDSFGLNFNIYFDQLREGLFACKLNRDTQVMEPDYKTRRLYHQILGQLLGIEKPQSKESNMENSYAFNQQNNKYYYNSPEELAEDIRKAVAKEEELKNGKQPIISSPNKTLPVDQAA